MTTHVHPECLAAIRAHLHDEARELLVQAGKNERAGRRGNRDWCYAAALGYERARGFLGRKE